MRETLRGVAIAQPVIDSRRQAALGRSECGSVPFLAIRIVDRDEGRLPARRQPHVAALELPVDALSELLDRAPLRLRVRLGHARRLPHARDRHAVLEFDLAVIDGTADRRRR